MDVTTSIIVTLVSSLISGIVAVIISIVYYRRYEKRRTKIDTLKRFFANRYDLKGDEFSRAINEIFVIFHDSEEVLSALRAFHQRIIDKQNSEDELLRLHKAMCNAVNIAFESSMIHSFSGRLIQGLTAEINLSNVVNTQNADCELFVMRKPYNQLFGIHR